jgi:hypothetical protein
MLRGGEAVALASITASKRRLEQIMWVMRPGKQQRVVRHRIFHVTGKNLVSQKKSVTNQP